VQNKEQGVKLREMLNNMKTEDEKTSQLFQFFWFLNHLIRFFFSKFNNSG